MGERAAVATACWRESIRVGAARAWACVACMHVARRVIAGASSAALMMSARFRTGCTTQLRPHSALKLHASSLILQPYPNPTRRSPPPPALRSSAILRKSPASSSLPPSAAPCRAVRPACSLHHHLQLSAGLATRPQSPWPGRSSSRSLIPSSR